MNTKKTIFFASLAVLGALVASSSFLHTRAHVSYAQEGPAIKEANYNASSFAGEQDVDSSQLSVKVTSSTKTTMGQSFTFMFSTGGTGFQDNTRTFVVAPTDSSFSTYYDEFKELTSEEKEVIQEQYENGEYETKNFGGQIYSLVYQSGVTEIVVPRSLARGIFFKFELDEIAASALTSAAVENGIKTVTIPNSIEYIYEDSFPSDLGSSFTFNVEFAKDEVPATWDANWAHGATVHYGYSYPEAKADAKISGSTVDYGDKTLNYIIGYYPSTGTKYPLVLSYKLLGGSETLYYEFSKSTTSSIGSEYDGVGYVLYGYTNSLFADIAIALEGEQEIDFDSLVVHNIFPAKQSSSGYVPDTDHLLCSAPMKSFSSTLSVEDFIGYRFDGISTFSGYTAIDLVVDHAGDETYKVLRGNYYSQYQNEIESGRMYIRYRLSSLTSCDFNVVYEKGGNDVTVDIPIATPVNQHTLESKSNNFVSFLFKNSDVGEGFNAKSVKQLSFVSFYVTLDLFSRETGVVARSGYTARFGYMMVMPYAEGRDVFDINGMLFIMMGAYIAAFAVLSVVAFFYFKNKYKNDEFRRLKPKSFIFKAILGLFGSLIVILCITFIVIRSTAFNNAIIVYNPVDAYIIISVVASVLIIGYFIKYLVTITKANNTRKRNIKLKLNEDVDDDGTK